MYKIYGRNNCIWCDRAKELLESKNLDYVFLNIEEDKQLLAEYKWMFMGSTTVPKIILMTPNDGDHDHKYIGGYKELYEWLRKPSTKS